MKGVTNNYLLYLVVSHYWYFECQDTPHKTRLNAPNFSDISCTLSLPIYFPNHCAIQTSLCKMQASSSSHICGAITWGSILVSTVRRASTSRWMVGWSWEGRLRHVDVLEICMQYKLLFGNDVAYSFFIIQCLHRCRSICNCQATTELYIYMALLDQRTVQIYISWISNYNNLKT